MIGEPAAWIGSAGNWTVTGRTWLVVRAIADDVDAVVGGEREKDPKELRVT